MMLNKIICQDTTQYLNLDILLQLTTANPYTEQNYSPGCPGQHEYSNFIAQSAFRF